MTDINVPLFQSVMDHVHAHPEELDSGNYWRSADNACGTAGCVAGHAVVMSGHRIRFDHQTSSAFYCVDGRLISDVAREELGLSEDQAGRLFDADNSLAQLWYLASEFTDGAIKIRASVPIASPSATRSWCGTRPAINQILSTDRSLTTSNGPRS